MDLLRDGGCLDQEVRALDGTYFGTAAQGLLSVPGDRDVS
jgi:hypothetical protein